MKFSRSPSSDLSLLAGATLLWLAGCGSHSAGESEVPPASAPPLADDQAALDPGVSEEPEAAPIPAPNCDDGTCFLCGEGLCPMGAYCDSGAPSGPACAWLSECPATPDCACVRRVLGAACSCEMSGGAPRVSCNE